MHGIVKESALDRALRRRWEILGKATSFALFVAAASPAHAIRACPPSPCLKHSGLDTAFDESACRAAATWIATGRIVGVRRRYEGPPHHRVETATFELQIVRWEKGIPPARSKLKLFVGWCGPRLPRSTAGVWHFWGTGGPVPDAGGDKTTPAAHRVLFLQRLHGKATAATSASS
jgi:hypothetical protein